MQRRYWADYSKLSRETRPPTERAGVEQLRSQMLAAKGDNTPLDETTTLTPERAAISAYVSYLWTFDWEWHPFVELHEQDPSKALPEALAGYDRATYAQEANEIWQQARGDNPGDFGLSTDLYVAALTGGCSEAAPVLADLLLKWATETYPSQDIATLHNVLQAECEASTDYYQSPCRAALDRLADTPHYVPGAFEPTPRDRVMNDCEKIAKRVHGKDAPAETLLAGWANPDEIESHGWYKIDRDLSVNSMLQSQPKPNASNPASGGSGPADAGSSVVSVSLSNACSQTVKLFFGDDPGFGSGRSTTLNSNTRINHQGKVGDMIWLVDENGDGIGNVSLSASTSSVEVASSCSSLTAQ